MKKLLTIIFISTSTVLVGQKTDSIISEAQNMIVFALQKDDLSLLEKHIPNPEDVFTDSAKHIRLNMSIRHYIKKPFKNIISYGNKNNVNWSIYSLKANSSGLKGTISFGEVSASIKVGFLLYNKGNKERCLLMSIFLDLENPGKGLNLSSKDEKKLKEFYKKYNND